MVSERNLYGRKKKTVLQKDSFFSYFAEKLLMKYLPLSLLMLTAIITPLAGQEADTAKYVSLDPYYFHLEYLKDDSSLMLDVRMPFEFRGKRIRDAVNIPTSQEMETFTDTLSRSHSFLSIATTATGVAGQRKCSMTKASGKSITSRVV